MNLPKSVAIVIMSVLSSSLVAFGATTTTALPIGKTLPTTTTPTTPTPITPTPTTTLPPGKSLPPTTTVPSTPAASADADADSDRYPSVRSEHEDGDGSKRHHEKGHNEPLNLTGTISGDTLTVTSISSERLYVGIKLSGNGIPPGTKIVAFGTGKGGVGTYVITTSPTAN